MHCVEPMLRVWEQTTPWMLQAPYEQLLATGRLDIGGGCAVGFDPQADVMLPLDAVPRFAVEYRKDQTRGTLADWLSIFLREGRVSLPGEIEVVLEDGV